MIKKILFFSFCSVFVTIGYGQEQLSDKLLTAATLSNSKLTSYLSKNGYFYAGKEESQDTVLTKYNPKRALNRTEDSITRSLCRADISSNAELIYETSSIAEFKELAAQFKNKGFLCYGAIDSLLNGSLKFQHQDVEVTSFLTTSDSSKSYGFRVKQLVLPNPKNLRYADDLLAFTSQESLEFYFGRESVRSDIYYFSDKEVSGCAVLFPNTDRQVVFIWQDEINKCTIRYLRFGGQQKLESLKENDNFIAENRWAFKNGIRAGMPLAALRKLNENDFKFYGGNADNPGAVLPDSTGKIDFRKVNVVLGCMNCTDDKFLAEKIINADDAIADERILFVMSLILNP